MRVIQMVKTETDYSALVDNNGQRLTLTYAEQPDEAQVLDDAEQVFADTVTGDTALPDLGVPETATLDDKKAILSDQVLAAAALAGTEPALAGVAAALDDVAATLAAEGMSDGG